ncbi:hypothetical protein NDK47_25225 [Brevibacillus ruminantium]|uniref:Uncharacterized protein n=1 Tax=Brevibacillus ruminantium TaxID=2950604 RepID=A0ABY4WDX4_9BACL|nr:MULTISPECIES: hypothetical protein [Brevibacillus]EJL46604.1 hypothetical protein PMI08_01099 [Brevibacillus sp. CF112]MCM3472347.1 hypothetical protein [Brevibacillus borstelensis]MCM3561747.1 hypothetical protein [Brevibacillus borstelensis]MCM3590131.1 hypothetical protein [Brevibacillus borstelensis]MED1855103.1 hypothetical protein [Brevibacillus borstelensis]
MRTIKTIQDVRLLREARVFSDAFAAYLEEEFLALKEAFDFDGLEEEFTLDMHGYMVVLEKGDNLRDLSVVGLDRNQNGLLGCLPEFVEKVERNGEHWYKVVVIYTNEYGMSFLLPLESVADDEQAIAWLEDQVERDAILLNY